MSSTSLAIHLHTTSLQKSISIHGIKVCQEIVAYTCMYVHTYTVVFHCSNFKHIGITHYHMYTGHDMRLHEIRMLQKALKM